MRKTGIFYFRSKINIMLDSATISYEVQIFWQPSDTDILCGFWLFYLHNVPIPKVGRAHGEQYTAGLVTKFGDIMQPYFNWRTGYHI